MNHESVKPDYTSIATIIQEAVDKKLMLPEFQRPFVWTIEQTKDLFDSLTRGIFIGTFVMAKPQFDLTCRSIDTRPRAGKGSRAKQINHTKNMKIYGIAIQIPSQLYIKFRLFIKKITNLL